MHSRLPDDIIWFEPPTICRWETIQETEISEKIENKTAELIRQRSMRSMLKKPRQRSEIVIEDFDLLRIPSRVDINFIIQEVIVPRIPDGYTIALSNIPTRRNSLIVEPECPKIDSAKDFLIPTDSPRPLHPKLASKVKIKIIDRKVKEDPDRIEYLFSKLIQDLDDLRNKQIPQIERQMDEISELLSASVPDEQNSDSGDAEPQTDDMSFLRSDEYAWGLSKKPETVKETKTPSDESDDDSEDSSHADEE